jgi:uncharacterized oxidoreductase
MSDAIVLTAPRLRALTGEIFRRLQVPEDEVRIVADVLMEASLSGYYSHGFMRIPVYVEGIRSGRMVPGAPLRVLRESAAAAWLDAGSGLGPVSAVRAVRRACDMARASGAGVVTVVNGNDVARLGSYVEEPARAGLIVLLMVNDAGGNPAVVPWGGTQAFLSTNPLAAGIPRPGDTPIVIDVSTSVAAEGQVKVRRNRGVPTPDGWLVDLQGNPVNDPDLYLSRPRRAALQPLGGAVAGHKGYALSLLVEALAGALSGAGCSAADPQRIDRNGLFVLAIDPEQLTGLAPFLERLEALATNLKAQPLRPADAAVELPGEGAARRRQRHGREGIPVDAATWARIRAIAQSLQMTGV